MKKWLMTMILVFLCVFSCLPVASASASLCFVAVNDSIPLYLSASDAPFTYNNITYIPYTAFEANPGGIQVSMNSSDKTLTLFTRTQKLIYDLERNSVANEDGLSWDVSLIFSNGTLFIPISDAAHFGLSVSLLRSKTECPIIRFVTGSQVYDDAMFVEKAENFIHHTVQEYEKNISTNPSQDPVPPDNQNPGTDKPVQTPSTVYLVLAEEAVSQRSFEFLQSHGITGAFFFTAEQFLNQPELARAISAAGYTIGITVSENSSDPKADLAAANAAMSQILFYKSLLAFVPHTLLETIDSYFIVPDFSNDPDLVHAAAISSEPQLLICKTSPIDLQEQLLDSNTTVLQLLETTVVSVPELSPENTEEE